MVRAGWLRSHSSLGRFCILLRADWLVWLLWFLHVTGLLGGAGAGGHRTDEANCRGNSEGRARSEKGYRDAVSYFAAMKAIRGLF